MMLLVGRKQITVVELIIQKIDIKRRQSAAAFGANSPLEGRRAKSLSALFAVLDNVIESANLGVQKAQKQQCLRGFDER